MQFKLSPRWLFMNAFEAGGEIRFDGPLPESAAMLDSLLLLHRKRDEARVPSTAPRTALERLAQ